MPFVIEPAVSIDRILLALLVDAYDEEVVESASGRCCGSTRSSRR